MTANRGDNSRGIAVPALVIMCAWAGLTILLGVIAAVLENWNRPAGGAPFQNDTWMNITFALFALWMLSLNGMLAAAILGAVALSRAKVGWLRSLAFAGSVVGGPIFALWWSSTVDSGDAVFPDPQRHTTSDVGLIVIAVIVLATGRWLLAPALRRRTVLPPPDPSTRLYSDSTT